MRFHEEPMSQIWDRLFVGCYYDAVMLNQRNPKDIGFVVNLTPDPIEFGKRSGIQTITVGLNDGEDVPKGKFDIAMHEITRALAYGNNVLIHCHAGISRAPSITAAYMYRTGFASFDDCLKFIKEKRPIVHPHYAITNSLKKLMKIWPYSEGAFQ